MTKKGVRLLAVGSLVVFFILITSSDLGSLEQAKSKIRLTRLIVLDEGNESEQEYEAYRYDEAKKGHVVVYAAMVGYIDSNDTEYFPWFNISLKKMKKLLVRVDFMCTITAKVIIEALMIGTDASLLLDEERVDVKKNTYYRAEFEIDPEEGEANGEGLGINDFIAIIYPSGKDANKFTGGGATISTARFELKK